MAYASGAAVGAGENVCALYENEAWVEAVQDPLPTAKAKVVCLRRASDVLPDAPLLAVSPRTLHASAMP